jgi:hypothetical protein
MSIEHPAPVALQLGVSGLNPRCLLLLPLAYVAGTSRRRDRAALEVLFDTAAARAGLDREGVEVTRSWLHDTPSMEQLEAGLLLLRRLRDAKEPLFSPADLLAAVIWAGSAAQLDREALGTGCGAISSHARRAMRNLEAWLGVDVGEVWADVLAELGEELPRSRNLLAPCFKTLPESSRCLAAPASERLAPVALGRARAHIVNEHAAPISIPFPLVRRAREREVGRLGARQDL